MSSIGYRPKGESGPLYHPDRDYAYITPTLMRLAIERLETGALSDEAKAWQAERNITSAEIMNLADSFARAQRDFVNAADPVSNFDQALNRRDWFDTRYEARQFLFAVIGEVFCAAWFTAVRDVTHVNEVSPAAPGMIDFISTVRAFVDASDSGPSAAHAKAADLQLRNDVLQSRLNTVYARVCELEAAAVKSAEVDTPPVKNKSCSWFSLPWTRK